MADIVKAKAKILIVEDEPIVAMDVESLLVRLAYNVVAVANNGKEAIEKAETLLPDLILMDIHIQGEIDGIQAADEIHRRFQVPIIFLTAYADEATLQRAKGAAPFGYILKPFEESELGTAIEVALHKHRSIQAREKISKEMLEQSEKHFKLFVESVKDYAIFMLDLMGKIVSWNPGAERITGYLASEVIGKDSSIFYTLDGTLAKLPQKGLEIALQSGRFEEEVLHVRKDNSRYLANSVVTALVDSSGNAIGFTKVVRDITEKKRNEQLIKEQTEELEQFAYRTSHDLRSPLLSLGSLLDFISEDINEGQLDEARANIVMCTSLILKLKELIDGILALTKADHGREPPSKIDFEEIMEMAKIMFKFDLELGKVELRSDFTHDTALFVSKARILQVVDNLISNAIKYRDSKKPNRFVMIRTKNDAENFYLEIEDNGVGIPAKDQPYLFKMFKRFHPELSFGSGLGLYIVKKHLNKLSAKLDFVSSNEGTSFRISIPMLIDRSEPSE